MTPSNFFTPGMGVPIAILTKKAVFIVIDKKTKLIGVWGVSDDAYIRGEEKIEAAEANYLKYAVQGESLNSFTTRGTI